MKALKKFVRKFGGVRFVAEALGVTQGCVYHWLSGRRTPSRESISALVRLSRGDIGYEDFMG